jgi:hypothetical protein
VLVERLLERMQPTVLGDRLDRVDPVAVRLHGQGQARAGRSPVEQHRAGAADSVLAAHVRAVQRELVTEEVGQQEPRLDAPLVAHPVDSDGDLDHVASAFATSAFASSRL